MFQLLHDNEALKEIFVEVEKEIFDQWSECTKPEGREALYFKLKALGDLRDGIYARTQQ
jgi:hypothetical protein